MLPKKPKGPFQAFLKEKKGQKPAKGENMLSKKYVEKAEKDKERYDRQMSKFQDKVFDMPKKPHSGFNLYVQDRMPDLKKAKPNAQVTVLLRQIAKEWKEGKDVDTKQYNKNAEKDKRRFKKQLKEFQKMGYYTKEKAESEEETEDKSKKSQKKKSSSKASTKKSKSQRPKSKSKSKKKSQNVASTKKSKK